MRLRVLGPVEIETVAGEVVGLVRRQERCLLAVLLLEPNRIVPMRRLCELLWESDPPPRAHRAVHSHIARIRAVLASAGAAESGVAVVSRGDGYLIRVDPDMVDAHRFQTLVGRATAITDLAARDELLREALALWRGPALQNATSEHLRERLSMALDELRMTAIEESMATGVALGRHRELIPELSQLAEAHPTRERLIELHMLALYRSGRTADALDLYGRVRAHLAAELGLDPGVRLRRLHQAILRDEEPSADAGQPRSASLAGVRPAQLPTDVTGFTGRGEYLRQLDALLAGQTTTPTTAVVISAIAGTAGVGKTALAVHWAHRVADQFPDGQLYMNLRGFHPVDPPMAPAEAVRGFLDAFGISPQRIPVGLDAQVGLYRSVLAGRRVLVVLDNAKDSDQVRPLLPGTPGCLVAITSRNQLSGLVATEGAHPVVVSLLPAAEARQLMAGRLGAARIAAEPQAVEDIITLCARLPLALAITAARAVTHPEFPLYKLAEELRDARGGLDALAGEDAVTDVRAVFSWSYQALPGDAARLFRLLGLHPGADISVSAAASLTGAATSRTRQLLAELAGAHLVVEHTPGRYALHDLLRAYATELVQTLDGDAERDSATRRLFDHYVHTAHVGDRLLNPHRDPLTLDAPPPGTTPEELTTDTHALAWFTIEHAALLAVVETASTLRLDTHTWRLAWALTTYLDRRGHWHDQTTVLRAASEATRRLGDRVGQAQAHRLLAGAYSRVGRLDEAYIHYGYGLDISTELGDLAGQAHSQHGLAWASGSSGRNRDAVGHAEQALRLYQAAGHESGETRTLNAVGWYHSQLGEHEQALAYCEQALALTHRTGDRYSEAETWDSIGYAHHHLGHFRQAAECYQRAVDLHHELGDRYRGAETLTHLGDTHLATGDTAAAKAAWRRALETLEELDHPDADDVRARIKRLDLGTDP